MIHPSNLLRPDLNEGGEIQFSAPEDAAKSTQQVDCGLAAFPRIGERLEKYAKPGIFLFVLSVNGFFHGVILHYFRSTSVIWGKHYNIDSKTIDWIIYVNEFLVGVFALFVSFWGNKTHRPKWIGVLTMFLAIMGLLLAIPEIYKPFKANEVDLHEIKGPSLCNITTTKSNIKEANEFHWIAFILIIVFQMVYAMTNISFLSHGLSYIDDHISENHSPAYIGASLAGLEVGKQVGTYFSWLPIILNSISYHNIFLSPAWLIIILLTFIFGLIIVMFPRVMPTLLMKKLSHSICSLAFGNEIEDDDVSSDGFFITLFRLLKNRILILITLSTVILQSVLINFEIFEDFFNQSRFLISNKHDTSGYSDPSVMQYSTNLLRQPFVFFSMLASGLMISKSRPRAKYLAISNIAILTIMMGLFASTRLYSCDRNLHNEHFQVISIPYCSSRCHCSSDDLFTPVCLQDKTYYSPCFAGCDSIDNNTNIILYQNCKCGDGGHASEGPCSNDACNFVFALSQVNNIISSGFLATLLVTNLVITLRCVNAKDKATAIGFQQTLLGIIPYLPVKLAYEKIMDLFCQYRNETTGVCQLYSDKLAMLLSITTLVGMLLATLLMVVLFFIIDDLELFRKKRYENYDNEDDINNEEHNNNYSHEDSDIETSKFIPKQKENIETSDLQRTSETNSTNSDSIRAPAQEDTKQKKLNSMIKTLGVPVIATNVQNSGTANNYDSQNNSTDSLRELANIVGDDHDSDDSLCETDL